MIALVPTVLIIKTLHPAFGFNSNKIRPDDFAELLNEVGRYYNEAYLAVESNTGLWVLTELNEKHKYPKFILEGEN